MLIDTDYLDTLPLYVLDELRLLTRNAYDRAKRANATPEEKKSASDWRKNWRANATPEEKERLREYNRQYQRARRAKLKSV